MAREIKLPDIGDFKDVPIIEIHVKPGQKVAAEEVLVTLESDKATMDVPSPAAGVIADVKIKVGDKVSEGAVGGRRGGGGAEGGAPRPAAGKPAPDKAEKPAPAAPAAAKPA